MKGPRTRSGPIYLQTARGTISLVFEATVRNDGDAGNGRALELVGKPDVYVIDGDGVRLVRHRSMMLQATLTGAAIYLLLWAIFRLLQSREQ